MTPTTEWAQFAQTLGVAAPLVAILLYLLRQSTEERQRITDRFLSSMDKRDAESIDARLRSAQALNELTGSIREHDRRCVEEHLSMIRALDGLEARIPAR